MKLELKVEQANSSSDEEDFSQSSTDIVMHRKVSCHNTHTRCWVQSLLVYFAEHNTFSLFIS